MKNINFDKFRNAVKSGLITWRKHALVRMMQRKISQKEVFEVLSKGNLLNTYKKDRPYPSCLLFKKINQRPLAVVASYSDVDNMVYVITTYETKK